MSKYTLLFPSVEEMAGMLERAGWRSPCDAQWEGLEGVLRDVRGIVEGDALKQRTAGAIDADRRLALLVEVRTALLAAGWNDDDLLRRLRLEIAPVDGAEATKKPGSSD